MMLLKDKGLDHILTGARTFHNPERENNKVLSILFRTMSDKYAAMFLEYECAMEVWTAIERQMLGNRNNQCLEAVSKVSHVRFASLEQILNLFQQGCSLVQSVSGQAFTPRSLGLLLLSQVPRKFQDYTQTAFRHFKSAKPDSGIVVHEIIDYFQSVVPRVLLKRKLRSNTEQSGATKNETKQNKISEESRKKFDSRKTKFEKSAKSEKVTFADTKEENTDTEESERSFTVACSISRASKMN